MGGLAAVDHKLCAGEIWVFGCCEGERRRVCDLPANIDPPHLGRIVMKIEHVWAPTCPLTSAGRRKAAHV